ncbi:MAG TPA: class I SAM-dependent methyltransferase [Polyangiaceae bacterium]|nr:class I SAM-dependent methyltransferase [Polyangiaceae bacterium]
MPDVAITRNEDKLRDFFASLGADYIDYRPLAEATTRQEVEFYLRILPPSLVNQPNRSCLDMCCGYGRHTLEFARRGWRATGVDATPALIELARTRASREGIAAEFLVADMLQPLPAEGFALASLLGTSFGFYETEQDNVRALAGLARCLQSGGALLLELFNPAFEAVRARGGRTLEHRPARGVVYKWEEYESFPSAKRMRVTYQMPERSVSLDCKLRLYTTDELTAMARGVGLELQELYGDHSGEPFTDASPRMIAVLRKV